MRLVKQQLSGHLLAITSDGWTARNGLPFSSLTAHFVDSSKDKWQLVNRMVDLQHAPGRHTASRVAELIVGLCDKWDLKRSVDDPITVTGDKATNMLTAIHTIPTAQYVPCFSHTIHRAVVDVLANDSSMQGIVGKITKLGLHFAKSTAGAGAFAAWQS